MKPSRSENSSALTLAFIDRVLPGAWRGPASALRSDQSVRISSDSRHTGSEDVFIALRGDRFDGHDFLAEVARRGAAALVYQTGKAPSAPLPVGGFAVDDTLDAYRRIAAAWRAQFSIPVVAVAGSVGKTTTKELLAAILTGKFKKILKTQASENGYVGIPKTLLSLTGAHDVAVIEVGIDEIGAMEKHLELLRPTHTLVTHIAEEHLEKLLDLPTVAREECRALSWTLEHGGRIAVDAADPFLLPFLEREPSSLITGYGLSGARRGGADFLAGTYSAGRSQLEVSGSASNSVSLACPLPGVHNAGNLLAAVAMARTLGLDFGEIGEGLLRFSAPAGRTNLVSLKEDVQVLCDYYNANPSSMEAAIELLPSLRRPGQALHVCLGDMLELGATEAARHRGLAKVLLRCAIDRVWLHGKRMAWLSQALTENNYAGELRHFIEMEPMQKALAEAARPHALYLIKGSRGMKMERLFEVLKTKF